MATLYEQRNLSMTPEQWRALEEAAVTTNSRSTRGPDAYQPSWRKLIQRIADGDFYLTEKEPYRIPPAIERAVAAIEAFSCLPAGKETQPDHEGGQSMKTRPAAQLTLEAEPA